MTVSWSEAVLQSAGANHAGDRQFRVLAQLPGGNLSNLPGPVAATEFKIWTGPGQRAEKTSMHLPATQALKAARYLYTTQYGAGDKRWV